MGVKRLGASVSPEAPPHAPEAAPDEHHQEGRDAHTHGKSQHRPRRLCVLLPGLHLQLLVVDLESGEGRVGHDVGSAVV